MFSFLHEFLAKVRDSLAAVVHNKLYYDMKAEDLLAKTLNCTTSGISSEKLLDTEVIVSLTTHGRRIYEVYLAIEAIMQGSIKPNRVVLWLSKEFEGNSLPQTLQNQIKRGLEVRYTQDIGPYTKLIPALQAFPEATIVTIDDDIIYPYDTLELLLQSAKIHPDHICANRILVAQFDKKGKMLSFLKWKEPFDTKTISPNNFFEGLGGVLYPPHCFTDEVFKRELYTKLCPTADDMWFNTMAWINQTPVVSANTHYSRFPLIFNNSVQDIALWRINNREKDCPHDRQLHALLDHYHINLSPL